jgi:hypothetical protein
MKKAVLGVWMTAWAGIALAADPETAWREAARNVVTTNGLKVARSTSVTTEPTTNTPAFTGQFLFGGAGAGTNGVWVAKGLTTNDWVKVAP